MDPQKITELANLLRQNGDKLLSSESTFTLSGAMLRALNDSFTLITDSAEVGEAQKFQVVKTINHKSPVFRDLQLIYDFVQKTTILCIKHYPTDEYFEGNIDISKFRALKNLEVQKSKIRQITGIQPLRLQIQQLTCTRSISSVDEIIINCGGDNSNGFVWNELKRADFSYNSLQTVDTSLEFAQYLQHLNLRHNQLNSVKAIKWLPHLKTLDLSFNCLQYIPQFHVEAYKRLQSLNMNNNYVEDLNGVSRLEAITDLDVSDNCLLDHSCLLPISALLTLKFLNLFGNPLSCHPKHRLATAQFLHKNCATVRFVLDFAELTKNEKAVTGRHQLRHVGSLHQFMARSSSTTISLNSEALTSHTTPASSVGSVRSFKLQDSSYADAEASKSTIDLSGKKRASKIRTVDIKDDEAQCRASAINNSEPMEKFESQQKESLTKSFTMETNTDHLEAKEQIKTLREKYGTEWLQYGNAEMLKSAMGIESISTPQMVNDEQNKSRQLFNDFLGEFSSKGANDNSDVHNLSVHTSTPNNLASRECVEENLTPIKLSNKTDSDTTLYMSPETATNSTNKTSYKSVLSGTYSENEKDTSEVLTKEEKDDPSYLKNVYPVTVDDESEVSEPEDDEEPYIVYTTQHNEAIFLTISSNFLREKDTLTQRTKTKWSLKILESCDRLNSNTLRINFDTVKIDKQERIYIVEDGLCQELEKLLRNILSKRDLTEMNQSIYRCVNCTCQFSHENKNKSTRQEIRCPDCKSLFVAEIHDIPRPRKTSTVEEEHLALSPAAIVEESPVTTPLVVEPTRKNAECVEETNSIGSANSLNESSSCSKISNSQSSFDSNQSVVGSTNTERDNELNCESDVDILSNPSQSSIEVLDNVLHAGRKTSSEERRISQAPYLETITDQSYKQEDFADSAELLSFLRDNTLANANTMSSPERTPIKVSNDPSAPTPTAFVSATTGSVAASSGPLAHFTLTESSSSGSITDSICTAYEQQPQARKALVFEDPPNAEKIVIPNLIKEEAGQGELLSPTKQEGAVMKREDSGISSVFGALFQSTNILMTSSKKLLDAESGANIQTGTAIKSTKPATSAACQPYKFNYTDFNDVDHRLKLYFYQTKFKEEGEHFKWIARGCIYNENTSVSCDGLVVMSTCKCYLMEIFAPENDDVAKWLKQITSVTADRLESIQLLPWKIGLSFHLKGWGGFLLLIKDITRTNSLLLFFENISLYNQCQFIYQPDDIVLKRLSDAIEHEKLQMLSVLNNCVVTLNNGKRTLHNCCLLTTDTHIHLTTEKFNWLTLREPGNDENTEIEICVKQFMTNLIEIERIEDHITVLNFLDETQESSSTWTCNFETKENAKSCLLAISQSWEKLFGVPLITEKEIMEYC